MRVHSVCQQSFVQKPDMHGQQCVSRPKLIWNSRLLEPLPVNEEKSRRYVSTSYGPNERFSQHNRNGSTHSRIVRSMLRSAEQPLAKDDALLLSLEGVLVPQLAEDALAVAVAFGGEAGRYALIARRGRQIALLCATRCSAGSTAMAAQQVIRIAAGGSQTGGGGGCSCSAGIRSRSQRRPSESVPAKSADGRRRFVERWHDVVDDTMDIDEATGGAGGLRASPSPSRRGKDSTVLTRISRQNFRARQATKGRRILSALPRGGRRRRRRLSVISRHTTHTVFIRWYTRWPHSLPSK